MAEKRSRGMGENKRTLLRALLVSVLITCICMVYMIGSSEDRLGTVVYYAAHMNTVKHHVWTNIKARFSLPHNKHIERNIPIPDEVESCLSTHKVDVEFQQTQEHIQETRRTALDKACQKYYDIKAHGTHLPAVPLLVEDYHLVYAQTAKIAGTSWDRVFLVLAHIANSTHTFSQSKSIDKVKVNIPTLKNFNKKDRHFILQNFTTFMFSRHPFSRLLSAYNCKIGPDATAEHVRRGYYDRLRRLILKKHPTSVTSKIGIPDFRAFVSYLVDEDYFDDPHWKENYKLVSPCDIHYDIIGHFESLQDDAKFILQTVGAGCLVDFPSSKGSAATNSSHEDTLIQSYKTLSKDLIMKLYEKYRLDFLLFGYTFEIIIDGEILGFPLDT